MMEFLDATGRRLWERIAAMIRRDAEAPVDERERDALALELFAWQRSRSQPIDRVARAFVGTRRLDTIRGIPGVPTDAFKVGRVACFDPEHTTRTFRTSGTTAEHRGEHHFADTSLYTAAALAAGRRFLLPSPPYRFILLAEREGDAPESSLSFMLARFAEHWSVPGNRDPWMIDGGRLEVDRVRAAIDAARRSGERVALLGATFAFVHLTEELAPDEQLGLPPGSVVMPTGGFKGRSRELPPDELFALLERSFGVRRTQIVQEYGMTELSSQAYEAHGEGRAPGRYVAPPWMIVTAVDPDSLEPLPQGARGILRVIDLANVGSCIAIQTADLGTTWADGFHVDGRAAGATPRGCGRAMDAMLSLGGSAAEPRSA